MVTTMTNDLRVLAQAVVDAKAGYMAKLEIDEDDDSDYPVWMAAQRKLEGALKRMGLRPMGDDSDVAEAILAALNTERTQGYALAMSGEWSPIT